MESELGAVVGAVATILVGVSAAIGAIATGWLTRRSEKKAIQAAILAEVSALAMLVKSRRYREDLQKAADHVRKTKAVWGMKVPVPEHYCRIYAANVTSIGLLPADQAGKVVRFYQLIDSVVQDVSPGGALATGTNIPESFLEARQLLDEALGIADSLK
ncbi:MULTISPECIES: hypothetical protein [Stutzerimonas stutzeri subgroup]|uniref:hypothetical protein n=1 Tax=Stutzerimonas stutzeri subgroup TaxID=578833 RepID=UPI0028984B98|nr:MULTISPECIES: hypothetical protein [Stutzerimonas stutzeri subgroup]